MSWRDFHHGRKRHSVFAENLCKCFPEPRRQTLAQDAFYMVPSIRPQSRNFGQERG